MVTSEQLAKIADAWSSSTFAASEASARLGAVLSPEGEVPAELIAGGAEVGEALRAEHPDRIRAAIEAFSAATDWASIAAAPEVSHQAKLAVAMNTATTTRKTLLALAARDLLQLLAMATRTERADANLGRDLLLWLELADEQAKTRLLPRFAKTEAAERRFCPHSARPIALRAAELVLQFGSLEDEIRWYFEASPVGELAPLAGLAAERLATRVGLSSVPRGVPLDVGGIEAPYYTTENLRPMLEVAFHQDPALFHDLLAKACKVPNVQTHRAIAMTDGIPWKRDLEIRNDKEVVRIREHGPLVFSWSGAIGKSGKLEVELAKSVDEAASLTEARAASAEARLGTTRAAPRFILPRATKKTTPADLLQQAGGRFDRTTVRELVLAGIDLNPGCEDPWDRPPLFHLYRDPESVRFVLEMGANPEGKDGCDSTALEFHASTTTPESLDSARLLLEAGTTIGDKGFRRAVESGNVELLEVLAKHGRKPDTRTLADLTKLASEKRHHATVAFLRSIS